MIELESIERDGHTHLLFTLGNVTVEMSEREVRSLTDNLGRFIDGKVMYDFHMGDPGAYSGTNGDPGVYSVRSEE